MKAPTPLDLVSIVADPATTVIICCGAGGVGKTTTAAALALRAADLGRRTVVLTIDPARRLAQALGLTELTNTPQEIDISLGRQIVGAVAGGSLHAMMLDMRRTFDEMVLEHSEPERAAAIFDNSFYQAIASSFSGTQEYMAMEKLGQLASGGQWDLVVVDTPPSRNALDFLDAPQRLSSLFDGRLIRLVAAPARAGGRGIKAVVGGVMGLAAKGLSTILGNQMLTDAAAFVQSFDALFGSFNERAAATYELLRRPGTQFVVIAAPEPDPLREAAFFVNRLTEESMPLAGLVVNRAHIPQAKLSAHDALRAADHLEAALGEPNEPGEPGSWAGDGDRLAIEALRVHADLAAAASRENHLLSGFTSAHTGVAVAKIRALPIEVSDINALRVIADELAASRT